ncbi:hypothetical protein DFH06DRAFT_154048 [Mycena polygramma]|nr:hypothetical protein DFH06DRAFT_154048 [Mycena polygramma]
MTGEGGAAARALECTRHRPLRFALSDYLGGLLHRPSFPFIEPTPILTILARLSVRLSRLSTFGVPYTFFFHPQPGIRKEARLVRHAPRLSCRRRLPGCSRPTLLTVITSRWHSYAARARLAIPTRARRCNPHRSSVSRCASAPHPALASSRTLAIAVSRCPLHKSSLDTEVGVSCVSIRNGADRAARLQYWTALPFILASPCLRFVAVLVVIIARSASGEQTFVLSPRAGRCRRVLHCRRRRKILTALVIHGRASTRFGVPL